MTTSRAQPPTGVVPVLATPFHTDGSIDRASFRRGAEHALAAGVPAVMFPGLASEFYKLDDRERETLTGDLLQVAAGTPGTVIASVTDHATAVAVRQARRLADAGAGMLNLLPPHFLRPAKAALLDHVAAVLEAVAPLPVILQYAPEETGVAVDPAEIGALALAHSNLAAVKVEAKPPGRYVAALLRQEPAVPSLVGSAGLYLLDALGHGTVGVQPGASFVELYLRVWRAWEAGDHAAATALHHRLMDYLLVWMRSPEVIVAVEKLVAHRRGLIATPTCRAPHQPLDATDTGTVERFLAEFGADLDVPLEGR